METYGADGHNEYGRRMRHRSIQDDQVLAAIFHILKTDMGVETDVEAGADMGAMRTCVDWR